MEFQIGNRKGKKMVKGNGEYRFRNNREHIKFFLQKKEEDMSVLCLVKTLVHTLVKGEYN